MVSSYRAPAPVCAGPRVGNGSAPLGWTLSRTCRQCTGTRSLRRIELEAPVETHPPAPGLPLTNTVAFLGAFESTFLPGHGVDVAETTHHSRRWRSDLDADLGAGVRRFRYPLRWHRIETEPAHYDWHESDRILGHLRDRGAEPIVDLLHHTSYPSWL